MIRKITLACPGADATGALSTIAHEVDADVVGDFGIHRPVNEQTMAEAMAGPETGWRLTHIHSGLAIRGEIGSMREARALRRAVQLWPLKHGGSWSSSLDWTDLRMVRARIDAWGGAAAMLALVHSVQQRLRMRGLVR